MPEMSMIDTGKAMDDELQKGIDGIERSQAMLRKQKERINAESRINNSSKGNERD